MFVGAYFQSESVINSDFEKQYFVLRSVKSPEGQFCTKADFEYSVRETLTVLLLKRQKILDPGGWQLPDTNNISPPSIPTARGDTSPVAIVYEKEHFYRHIFATMNIYITYA